MEFSPKRKKQWMYFHRLGKLMVPHDRARPLTPRERQRLLLLPSDQQEFIA